MTLRETLEEAIWQGLNDEDPAPVILNRLLDVLSEHTDEWRYTSRIDGSGHRETIIPKLLAVLREDAS